MGFSLIAFKKSRRRKRLCGIVLFWGGLTVLILDMMTRFPTPVRGQYAVWWVLVVALGAALWMTAKRLPLEETIEVAKYCRGELKVTDLTSELNVTLDTAERILMALTRGGLCEDRGSRRHARVALPRGEGVDERSVRARRQLGIGSHWLQGK